MKTWIHKMKCMNCSLHFAAYSDHENWGEEIDSVTCPECGTHGPFMHWKEPVDGFIFQHVPGNAPLVTMGWND